MAEPINPYAAPKPEEPERMPGVASSITLRRLFLGMSIYRAVALITVALIVGRIGLLGLRASGFARLVPHAYELYVLLLAVNDFVALVAFCGALYCLAIPAESRGLGWIQASAMFAMAALIVRGAALIEGDTLVIFHSRQVLVILSILAKYVFLIRLCRWLERDDLAGRAANILKIAIVAIILAMLPLLVALWMDDLGQRRARSLLFLIALPSYVAELIATYRLFELAGGILAVLRRRAAQT